MKNLYIRDVYLLIFCCLTATIFFALNYSGFCFRKLRYLSSEEKIEFLFNIWNKSSGRRDLFIDGEYKVLERKKRYANFDEFLAKHPNCCDVNPESPYDTGPPNFVDRITGYDSGSMIRLKFNEEYIDSDGNVLIKKVQVLDRLQNCGESYW